MKKMQELTDEMWEKLNKFAEAMTTDEDFNTEKFSFQDLKQLAEKLGFNIGVVNYTLAGLKELGFLKTRRNKKKRKIYSIVN